MVEHHGPVHVAALLLIVAGGLHHVLRVTEQRQVHQLVIQTALLETHTHTHTHPLYWLRNVSNFQATDPSAIRCSANIRKDTVQ